jgi:hypothetical protein
MTETALHPAPRPQDVLGAQIRAVGLALRGPAIIVTALIALTTLLVTIEFLRTGQPIDFNPEQQVLFGTLGLLLPIGVWMGEERFGIGFLWTLPVDRRWHALTKVFAGWVWLMMSVAFVVLWLLALALLSGGNVFSDTLRVLPSFSVTASRIFDPGAVQDVRWTRGLLFWLVPFTAATGTYLSASALALGTRYPLRWIAGTVLGLVLLVVVKNAANVELPINGYGDPLAMLVSGPYGVDALLTARTESLQVSATLSTGETIVVWRALPDLAQWAIATFLWTAAGLVALVAAASRHRESRRA